jgi:SAM-dependent methyltransferase
VSDLLETQKRYYAARAPEYDDWWYRRGRYAVDAETERAWNDDIAEVERALDAFGVHGAVVELAAGTGIWTHRLAGQADRVVALDANPEVLAFNTAPADKRVVDVFAWQPDERYDLCFFSFWHSHVPDDRLDDFWRTVRSALNPGGRVFLVDNGAGDLAHASRKTARTETRTVADGREFEIVKRWWVPDELEQRVAPLGFDLELHATANGYFLYGGGR